MKHRKHDRVPPQEVTIQEAAVLFDGVEQRTVYRYLDAGMPRLDNGRLPLLEATLWWQLWRHRIDGRCNRAHDLDLLILLDQARALWPERLRTIGDVQRFLRQTAGFALSPSTLDQIRAP